MDAFPTPTRAQAAALDDRAEWPHRVAQWETPDGLPRYVILRALSVRDKMDAERAATRKGRDGATAADPWLLMVEEVRRGIVRPADLASETILGWSYAATLDIWHALQAVGGYVPARVAAELARIAGEPPPPRGAPARGADRVPDLVDDDAGAAPAGDAGEPGGADDGRPDR